MARVTHITPMVRSDGGMQHLVRLNRELDRAAGHESRVVALFETMPAGEADPDIGLGATWWWTPGRLRRVFHQRAGPVTRGALTVYHNAWGLPLLAPGDGALRRLAFLHTDWPGLAAAVRASVRWCDGIVCVSSALQEAVHKIAPDYPRDRVYRVYSPVSPPVGVTAEEGDASPRPWRIGYVGRLESAQKRVERLPALMRAWSAQGGPAEWHVIGDGPARARLERATAREGRVRFHGWLGGAGYWRALAALDAVVFFSDYEGTPLALLEAMSVGVAPIFPRIGGDGEELARQLSPDCVYPPGDLAAAARGLRALAAGDRGQRRARARQLVAGHTPTRYADDITRATAVALAASRHSAAGELRPARWSDGLPLAIVRRFHEAAIWC